MDRLTRWVARDEAEVADRHDSQQDGEQDAQTQEVAVATGMEWDVACPAPSGGVEDLKGVDAHGNVGIVEDALPVAVANPETQRVARMVVAGEWNVHQKGGGLQIKGDLTIASVNEYKREGEDSAFLVPTISIVGLVPLHADQVVMRQGLEVEQQAGSCHQRHKHLG